MKGEIDKFCILLSGSTAEGPGGRAIDTLIRQVISSSKIFVFGELLSVPAVQNLRNTEYSHSLATLELFAYGTYLDYKASPSSFLDLNDTQLKKLKQLSIISAATKNRIIPYTVLQNETGVEVVRELENLIIETIYSGIITARLNQSQKLLRVQDFVGRDVRPDAISNMIQILIDLDDTTDELLDAFGVGKTIIQTQRESDSVDLDNLQKKVDVTKKAFSTNDMMTIL